MPSLQEQFLITAVDPCQYLTGHTGADQSAVNLHHGSEPSGSRRQEYLVGIKQVVGSQSTNSRGNSKISTQLQDRTAGDAIRIERPGVTTYPSITANTLYPGASHTSPSASSMSASSHPAEKASILARTRLR